MATRAGGRSRLQTPCKRHLLGFGERFLGPLDMRLSVLCRAADLRDSCWVLFWLFQGTLLCPLVKTST